MEEKHDINETEGKEREGRLELEREGRQRGTRDIAILID